MPRYKVKLYVQLMKTLMIDADNQADAEAKADALADNYDGDWSDTSDVKVWDVDLYDEDGCIAYHDAGLDVPRSEEYLQGQADADDPRYDEG